MLLVHKPHSALLPSPVPFTHRRHPSAPVVVQPTRTPGLLTLSKPVRPLPSRQLPSQQRQNARLTPKAPKPAPVVRAQLLTPAAEITDKQKPVAATHPATPSPQPRGRSQAKNLKDKVQLPRSASHSSIRGKHGRQPSPPITTAEQLLPLPSQAEVPTFPPIKSINHFDPFLDNSSANFTPPSPTVGSKTTRRTPVALSKAIPVPAPRIQTSNLSRSDPLPSHLKQRPRPIPKRSSIIPDFPICDDMVEVAQLDSPTTPPATPRRLFDNGPSTAPISARSPGEFPFFNMPAPPPSPMASRKGNRKHRRAPSEGVFNMSSDEEMSSGPGGVVLNPDVRSLFPFRTPAPISKVSQSPFVTPNHSSARLFPSRESSPSYGSLPTESTLASNKFASSMFQNSPSPDELPDPLCL
ncbi:unnamed protein product [Cyclocybe aegerita]|uniref:Uncharacterized protein n=1 Tax=Cyclocybe aegerita TaxID=1973307 RepID=A0A8S0WK62_CYCAE|nr:unnamed protein product [Cyclocybe aegerita]